jgi:hypothetical protein
LQAIATGRRPYVEAQTQYGPDRQVATYALMQATQFTVRGYRLSELALNTAATAAFFAIILYAFGWRVGLGIVALSLCLSPLLIISGLGWSVFFRWFAPFVAGALLPLLLRKPLAPAGRYIAAAALGAVCGALA